MCFPGDAGLKHNSGTTLGFVKYSEKISRFTSILAAYLAALIALISSFVSKLFSRPLATAV